MGFLEVSKIILILIMPFMIFLIVSDFAVFDGNFYKNAFVKYKVGQDAMNAASLHEQVISFVKGIANELPADFNEREKQHLHDVRKLIQASKILLCILVILFLSLSISSALKLKAKKPIMNFFGKVLAFGGILAIAVAAALFLSVSLDFSSAFEKFHLVFFEKGTYIFDPANELIVRLYPEQLFMDIGVKILTWVFMLSVVVSLTGMLLTLKYKSKKNKNKKEWQS